MKHVGMVLWLLFIPLLAYGHGDDITLTSKSAVEVLRKFKFEETGATTQLFNGVKVFPDDHVIRGKVYLKGRPELTYTCKEEHGADGEDVIKCSKDS